MIVLRTIGSPARTVFIRDVVENAADGLKLITILKKEMKKLNQNQIIGIGIILVVITASLLIESESLLIGVPSGLAAAVGVGFILKWIPFKKSTS